LISREDYPNGFNLNPEQQNFRTEYSRQGVNSIRLGNKKRKLLSIALLPLSLAMNNGRNPGRNAMTDLNGDCPFVPGPEVAVITMTDHPARFPNQWHFIESRVLVNVGFIDEGGAPCVGGMRDMCRLRADFSKGPLMRGQQALKCDSQGELVAPRTGKLRVSRTGRWIDICVGRHSGKQNTVAYRLAENLLFGDDPTAVLAFDLPALPEAGEVIELDDVQKGDVLVTLTRRGQYFQAMFENNEPETQWPQGRVLPASRVEIFRVLNKMNLVQNDMTLLPHDWEFPALIAFERCVRTTDDGERIDVDPTSLTTLPGFTPSQALKDDFRKAVAPHGEFYLRAEQSGRVKAVEFLADQGHLLRLVFDNGQFQLVPSTATLYRVVEGSVKPLEEGDEVVEGEILGDACPRVRYASWELLEETLKDNLFWMLEEFMQSQAISHGVDGWTGAEILYDARYVASVLNFCAVGADKLPKWFWDLRQASEYFDPETGAIMLPPVRYDSWDQLAVVVNGVQFDLNDPFSPVPTEASANTSKDRQHTEETEESLRS
jgi:hypothetical protein